jgi:hypothetical protein
MLRKRELWVSSILKPRIYFLKYARSLETVPKNLDSVPEIHKAFEIANRANLTQAELDALQGREMLLDDRKRAIAIDRQESC